MTAALVLAFGLALNSGVAPIGGCPAAQQALRDAPTSVSGRDLAARVAAPLRPDLARLPSVQAALDKAGTALSPEEHAQTRRELSTTLDAVCARVLAPAPLAGVADSSALEAILERPQFSHRTVGSARMGAVLERLWDLIKEALYTAGWSSFSAWSRSAFLVAVLVAALWLGFALRRRPPDAPRVEQTLDWKQVATATEAELLRDALAARARGDLQLAVALEMAAVRKALSKGESETTLRSRTDREWIAEMTAHLPAMPQLPQLVQLASQFERLFYGATRVSENEADAFHREAEALRQSRGATSA